MKIEKVKHPMWAHEIWIAKHLSCEAHLVEFGIELNIQFIECKQRRQGHSQAMITELLKWCKQHGLHLASSYPMNSVWRRICLKNNIPYYAP